MPFLLSIGLLLLPYLLPSLPVIRLIHFILVLVNMKLSFTQKSFYPMCRGLIQLLQEMFLGPLVIILIAFKSIKSKAYSRMISSLFYKLASKCSSTFSLNFLHFKRRRSWTNIMLHVSGCPTQIQQLKEMLKMLRKVEMFPAQESGLMLMM